MSKSDEEKLLDDHSYDGIQEYDNPMPAWWVNLFWATVVFSVIYCVYYMGGFGPGQEEEYQASLEKIDALQLAAKEKATTSVTNEAKASPLETLIAVAKDPAQVEAGKQSFMAKCAACHGQKGEGLIGPNLTDDSWVHGGDLESIKRIIEEGVLQKGMIAWKDQLPAEEINQLVAYIRSIQDTNVAGKAKEGTVSPPTPL